MDSSPELQRLLEHEKQKMMMNEVVSKLTSECWDKCITGAPGSKFSSSETTCLTNCAHRFLDMSEIIAKRYEVNPCQIHVITLCTVFRVLLFVTFGSCVFSVAVCSGVAVKDL